MLWSETVARYIMFHKYTIPTPHVRPLKGGGPLWYLFGYHIFHTAKFIIDPFFYMVLAAEGQNKRTAHIGCKPCDAYKLSYTPVIIVQPSSPDIGSLYNHGNLNPARRLTCFVLQYFTTKVLELFRSSSSDAVHIQLPLASSTYGG